MSESTELVPTGAYGRAYWTNQEGQAGKYGAIGAACGAILSFFSPATFAIIPLLIAGAGTGLVLGSMFTTTKGWFRDKVHENIRSGREQHEINTLYAAVDRDYRRIFDRMTGRRDEVFELVQGRTDRLTTTAWDKLSDMPLTYLRYAYALNSLRNRSHNHGVEDIESEIDELTQKIQDSDGAERQRYLMSKAHLTKMLSRMRSTESRIALMRSKLRLMESNFEEICAHVVKNPANESTSQFVEDMIARVDIEEELSFDLNGGAAISLDEEFENLEKGLDSYGNPLESEVEVFNMSLVDSY